VPGCSGDQCCPDGSACPSASADFMSCPKPKLEDCTGNSFWHWQPDLRPDAEFTAAEDKGDEEDEERDDEDDLEHAFPGILKKFRIPGGGGVVQAAARAAAARATGFAQVVAAGGLLMVVAAVIVFSRRSGRRPEERGTIARLRSGIAGGRRLGNEDGPSYERLAAVARATEAAAPSLP